MIGLTRCAAVVLVAGAVVSHRMAAQEITDYGPFWQRSLHAGLDIGTAIPTGTFGENFGAGWDVGGNVALPVSPHGSIWLQADGNYESNLVRGATAAAYGANGGGASLTSATLNVVLNKRDYWGNLTPYLVFGGGAYWRLVELNNFAGGTYCDAFDGFPCLLNGKADAQVMCVDPTLAAHTNVQLLIGAYVTRLETPVARKGIPRPQYRQLKALWPQWRFTHKECYYTSRPRRT